MKDECLPVTKNASGFLSRLNRGFREHWENYLLQLMIMAILLPVAAQTFLAFLSVLVLLKNNGCQTFKLENFTIKQPEIAG